MENNETLKITTVNKDIGGGNEEVSIKTLGVDLDEDLAARFPINDDPSFDLHWGNMRSPDGAIVKP